jgi:hypothetical protein
MVGQRLLRCSAHHSPPVGGTVSRDPEDARRGEVRLLTHGLISQALEGSGLGPALTGSIDARSTQVLRRQIRPGAHALEIVLHSRPCGPAPGPRLRASAGDPGCWSFRRSRGHNRWGPVAALSRRTRTGRAPGQPCLRGRGGAGASLGGGSRGGPRPR